MSVLAAAALMGGALAAAFVLSICCTLYRFRRSAREGINFTSQGP